MTEIVRKPKSRTTSARQFVLGAAWMLLSFQTYGLFARRFAPQYAQLFGIACTLAALYAGFYIFSALFDGDPNPASSLGFVRRATMGREVGMGIAIGWGMMVLLILPMLLTRSLHPEFNFTAAAWNSLIVSLCVFFLSSFAEELGFRGYPFQRLIEAAGPAWATVLMAAVFGIVHLQGTLATVPSALSTVLFAVLASVAYLRTRALWLPIGLHLGWTISMGLLFGMPVDGAVQWSPVVYTAASSPQWLTGGSYGPTGSWFAPLVLLVGIGVLVRATREYAWEYTFDPIVGAGYPMDAPTPPQHTAMEQAAKPAPLVQILPTTPEGFSKTDSSAQ